MQRKSKLTTNMRYEDSITRKPFHSPMTNMLSFRAPNFLTDTDDTTQRSGRRSYNKIRHRMATVVIVLRTIIKVVAVYVGPCRSAD